MNTEPSKYTDEHLNVILADLSNRVDALELEAKTSAQTAKQVYVNIMRHIDRLAEGLDGSDQRRILAKADTTASDLGIEPSSPSD